jgi:protease IV
MLQIWGMNEILNGYWLVSDAWAEQIRNFIGRHGVGALPSLIASRTEPLSAIYSAESIMGGKNNTPQPLGIGVINIIGATSRYGDACAYGTDAIANQINAFNADETIGSIVLKMDTPGGSVNGVKYLQEVIASSNKPIVAWGSMIASAGMFYTANASHIMLENSAAVMVGSIGVKYSREISDTKIQTITAPKSGNKQLANPNEPIDGAALEEVMAQLTAIENEFHAVMNAGRPQIKKQVYADQGKVYGPAEGVRLGLADSLGTLNDALALASKLDIKNRKQKSKTNMSQKSYSGLAVLAGLSAFVSAELSEDSVGVSEAHLDALEAGASALQVQLATALADKVKAENTLATAMESLNTLNATLTAAVVEKDAAVTAQATAVAEAERLQGLITNQNEALGNTGAAPNVDPAPANISAFEAAAAREAELKAKFPKLAR